MIAPSVRLFLLTCLSLALAGGVSSPQILQAESLDQSNISFNRDIRPILSNNCFQCHGPDEKQREAGLRFDTQQGATAKLESGDRAIVPGKPEQSPLFERITSTDEFTVMPPPETGKSLTKRQVELLKQWIAQGAPWQKHWSLLPPTRPALPPVPKGAGAAWVQNTIDRFVLSRMTEQGLQPAAKADRRTLARRLSFDLTGLPPSPADVEDFLADPSPQAYNRYVEKLLANPHYGERMAIYWLDLVRFADTCGYHSDNPRQLWLYRDYVIEAFNKNKPFDQFTLEQLAGDLLPEPTAEAKIASGYNRVLQTTEEGGAQPKEYLAKYAADRVRNASGVWLGLTMGCAECHDHKYDPLTQKDFYSFASFFADIKERAVGRQPQNFRHPTPQQQKQLKEIQQQIAQLRQSHAAAGKSAEWAVLKPADLQASSGAALKLQSDGSVLASGPTPETESYTFSLPVEAGTTALRLEVLTDQQLPAGGPGRATNGNFVLSEFSVNNASGPVKLSAASATHSQGSYPVGHAIDGKANTGWAILPQAGRTNAATFELAKPLAASPDQTSPAKTKLTVTVQFNYGSGHAIGKFRLLGTRLPAHQRPSVLVSKLEKQREQIQKSLPTTLITETTSPRTMRVLPRGNWLDDSGPVVQPAIPEALGSLEVPGNQRATRLDLAKWVVDPQNPLTARVFVNRLWMLLHGRGLAGTLEDFGSQGQWPTHPALLDWLAVEFIESGWDIKHLVRLMVTSNTYQQSSSVSQEKLLADPYNKWLARQGSWRLTAELVRDNALAVGGLLVPQIGGPSVFPYQPVGYWQHLNFPRRKYKSSQDKNQWRRGLYTHWQRSFLQPALAAFDAPTREECTAQRPRSNTPLQALVLLNDPTFVEAARAFAERILREGPDQPSQQLSWAFAQALQRDPRPQEQQILLALYKKHLQAYQQNEQAVGELLKVGLREIPADLPQPELAAWTSVARVILNLHETITRY